MLAVIGASHHDLELTDLAELAEDPSALRARLEELVASGDSPLAGVVVLATCNRLEIYVDAERFHDALDAVTDAVAWRAGDPVRVGEMLQVRVGAPVAGHLFAVASGLDSMVVGEAEISGQVAAALRQAQAAHTATSPLNLLFQSAARTAKRVASTTDLGASGRSVASVALDVAGASVGQWPDAEVLVIGTGSFARVLVAALKARGARRIRVFSSSGRARSFAASRELEAVDDFDIAGALITADLVISASGTGAGVLSATLLTQVMASRDGRELPIVDLALRPDVSPEVRRVPGVEVIDLHTATRHAVGHTGAVESAAAMVIDAVERFQDDLSARSLDPAVVALRAHVEGTVNRELERLRAKLPPEAAAELAAEIDHAAHRMTRSLLHTPTVRARALARTGSADDYLRALHTLYGIEVGGPPRDQPPATAGMIETVTPSSAGVARPSTNRTSSSPT
jgi:glutamyl-tRNA reductase